MALSVARYPSKWLWILCCIIQVRAMAYSGGAGTYEAPYELSCKQDILELASSPSDCDKSFILTEDVDLEGIVFERSVVAPDAVVVPSFGEYENLFTGIFNGSGHVIANFSIVGAGSLGFFDAIGREGRVMHLGLEDVYVDGPSGSHVGMLAAVNMGDIAGCYTQGVVSSQGNVGGLVGYQLQGRILDCFSQGQVEGVGGGAGGLLGILWEGEVRRCYAASLVVSANSLGAGGLLGVATSGGRGHPSRVVSDSFWDVDISGLSVSGGGLGLTTEQMYDMRTYTEARWDFVGEEGNGINDIWMSSAEDGYPTLSSFSGLRCVWLVGAGTIDDPYLISNVRKLAAVPYYDSSGCYFELDADIDLSGIAWSVPVLSEFQGHLDGRGFCIRGFYQNGSRGLFDVIDDGATVMNLHLEECELQVEAGGGCLAGENHGYLTTCSATGVIRGAINTGGMVGRNSGQMSGCFFSGAVIGWEQAGGLAGENLGVMLNSWCQGAVVGDSRVGGLTGGNYGSIRSSFSLASVAGYVDLAGLIGINGREVADCYARGPVVGARNVGGLVGRNEREVSRCYSTGAITGIHDMGGLIGWGDRGEESVSDSFWDTDTSGIQTSAGGRGRASVQMHDINTFLDAGWDFVGETTNGSEDVWSIGTDSYPELTLSVQPAPVRVRR